MLLSRHTRSSHLCAAALAVLCVLGAASLAQAGFGPSVLVVRGQGVSAAVRQDAVQSLQGLAEASDDSAYVAATTEAGLEPASEQALTQVATQQFVTLMIVLERDSGGLRVTYRDGHSGQPVNVIDVGKLGKRLTPEQQAQIADGTQLALSGGGAAMPPTAAGVAPAPGPAAAGELPPPDEGVTDLPLPPPEEPAGPSLAAELTVGVGVGMREVSTPSNGGPRTLSGGLFPAADLGIRISTPPRGSFYFALVTRYQTSVFLKAHETPSGGVPRTTTLRAHHVQIGVLPGYRFTEGPHSTVLGLFLGWDVRGLGLVDELSIPAYGLHGPCVRPEFLFAIGDSLSLRIAPELIVLASVSKELRDLNAINGTGVGLGGEAALTLQVSDPIALALTFRESHVSVGTEWLVSFTDVERFITLQGVLQY